MPFQDPSTYNLGGSESSQITTSSDTVTFTAIESSGTAYLYKDFGASYFGDFSIQAVVNITANSGLASFVPISLANTPAVNDDALVTADDGMGLLFSTSGNPVPSFVNHEDETTTGGLASSAKSTDLYITIDRTGTTLTITIRTSSHGGTLVDSDTLTVPTTSYRYLYIGQSRGVGGGTTTATLRDIEVGCVPQNGIGDELAWWCPTLDDDNENTANLHDVTCQGLDGTLDASMTPAPAWVDDTGAGGSRALEFDGTNDLVSMGDVLDPGTGDFTWSLWLKASTTLDTSNAGGRVIQKRGTGAVGSVAGFTIGVRRNGTKVRITNTAIDDATNGYAISDSGTQDELGFDIGDTSTWIHLIAIVDRTADELMFYADGVLLNTSDISTVTGSLSNTRDFTLGASDDSETQYFKGLIDDARVWNRQLIASEISHLYDSGTGRGILGSPVAAEEYSLDANTTVFVSTGNDAYLPHPLFASTGEFILAGSESNLDEDRFFVADSASFQLTSIPTAFVVDPPALIAEPGEFAFSGNNAGFFVQRLLIASPRSYSLTGPPIDIEGDRSLIPSYVYLLGA